MKIVKFVSTFCWVTWCAVVVGVTISFVGSQMSSEARSAGYELGENEMIEHLRVSIASPHEDNDCLRDALRQTDPHNELLDLR